MARTKVKYLLIISYLVISVSTRSLPVNIESTVITDEVYTTLNKEPLEDVTINKDEELMIKELDDVVNRTNQFGNSIKLDKESTNDITTNKDEVVIKELNIENRTNQLENTLRNAINNIRPGQEVRSYTIKLTRENGNLIGEAILDVRLSDEAMGNLMRFDVLGLEINSVQVGLVTIDNLLDAEAVFVDNNVLHIVPRQVQGGIYMVVIRYAVPLGNDGNGIYLGNFNDDEYIAMNLHPINGRRVFPCMDEPNLSATRISFTFQDMEMNTILTNSQPAQDSTTEFRALQGPVHRWAMVAHNLNVVNIPVPNFVSLYARQGTNNQETQASVAINNYYTSLNEWTGVDHSDFDADQNGALHVIAVPDISRDWYGLSTLCIWEPYILMENNNAVKQRKTALVTIAEGIARQWFGWLIFPENWRDQWVIAGLGSYAAYEVATEFQTSPPNQEDISLVDMNEIFTTEVIQESLLFDSYDGSQPLRLGNTIYEDNEIRLHTQGLLKLKAPALLRMTRFVLSQEVDLVQVAAQGLLRSMASEPVTTRNFYDTLASGHGTGVGSDLIGSVIDFLTPWVENSGYPLITVTSRADGITIMQERFGFGPLQAINYQVPLTFTSSINPNFGDLFPSQILDTTSRIINMAVGDWIIFNLQGQGYYRVNYDEALWEGIIEALSDEETREVIHPLNRASLIDDAFVLARAGRVDYDVPLSMALTMELETDYAVWKAYFRNMEFLRKRLEPLVMFDDDLDDDIYVRMIRRAMEAFEEEIGFEPDGLEPAMLSLTRGLVMEYVCKVDYEPCVAAAVDIFYNPNNDEEVNPNIPPEIRPAVYCTMVREDEEGEIIEALEEHLENVQSRYERLVILESFACSQDEGVIQGLLAETISPTSEYVLEEKIKIFEAVAESSYQNSQIALNFLIRNTRNIRDMYGGPEKLDEVIFIMAENIADGGQGNDFFNWMRLLNSISNIDDSDRATAMAAQRIVQNLEWSNNRLEEVYEWIDENDASTVFVSTLLLCISMLTALLNQH